MFRLSAKQPALSALREVRSRQNMPPRSPVSFSVRCDEETAGLLEPMAAYFRRPANANPAALGFPAAPPPVHAAIGAVGVEIFLDLAGVIDVAAEVGRNEQEEQKLLAPIRQREAKHSNPGFLQKAPANVVGAERESLSKFQEQLATVRSALAALRAR